MKSLTLFFAFIFTLFAHAYAQPPLGIITGNLNICIGDTSTLHDATPGGTWSSSNPAVATIGSATGLVTGISMGTTTIYYATTLIGTASAIDTVYPAPSPILGTMTICAGAATTLTDATSGGTWSSSSPAIGTIGSSSGIVTGIAAGTDTITYAMGCKVKAVVTVNPLPSLITGPLNICVGNTAVFTDTITGGTWSSTPVTVATIGSSSGVVTGITAGAATITYTLPAGCSRTVAITVNPLPCNTDISSFTGNIFPEIFPNPGTNDFTVTQQPGAFHTLTIINQMGQALKVQQLNSKQTTADVKNLPPGLYYIFLKGEGDYKVLKFLKE